MLVLANGLDIVGLTREEAVAHLTGLEGQVTLLVQYKKEDYDSIMASHEAGDSFYIRTHFNYQPSDNTGEHAFKVGDIFHIKDTLFRGVGGSWLAIRVGPNGEELKKGTIPNKKKAEVLAVTQQESGSSKEAFPSKGRGSLFKRKSARRAKSLGKDHWEEVIFSGLATKFPPYERVILRDPAFVRPVVVFGAIADVARDKLLSEFPDRFESPQTDKGVENDPKKGKTGIIRFGAIREAMNHQKHCVLDVTPYHVDRLNYAQYYPIVIFLRGESKQAIKDVRSRWRGGTNTNKNPKKLQEHNERMGNLYAHLFTGTINHTTTDAWFPKLVEMIESQQRRPVWMSEKKPEEDLNDDFMFPMPNRMSLAGSPESELDLGRPSDDLDTSPMQKKRLVRSSSDPSINTADRVPGIPPYPAPPGYGNAKMPPFSRRDEWDDYRNPQRLQDRDGDWQMHPDDRYYPHPHHVPEGDHFQGGYDEFGPHRDRLPPDDPYRMMGPRQPGPPHDGQMVPPPGVGPEHRGYNDASSHDSDSYSRYVSSPANKHDDSKLRDKFGSLQVGGRERSPGTHDPYRFTRSTANPISGANIDRAKLSDLSARYRREDKQKAPPSKPGSATSPLSPGPSSDGSRTAQKKKEPPPVPAKTYSLKEVGMDMDEMKARNYENSNRAYNYSEVAFPPPPQQSPSDPRHHQDLPPPPPPHKTAESPYEYISVRAQNRHPGSGRGDNPPPLPPPLPREDYQDDMVAGSYEISQSSRAFANHVYMDHREVERVRSGAGGGDAEREALVRDSSGYTRPRTDDEQLRDLQRNRSRLKSDSRLSDRAKSESRLNDRADARWSKYKSWDNEKEGQRTFDAYKKLITPGFYGSRKPMSKSHDELREENMPVGDAPPPRPTHRGDRGSAFEAYKKPSSDDVRSAAIREDLLSSGLPVSGESCSGKVDDAQGSTFNIKGSPSRFEGATIDKVDDGKTATKEKSPPKVTAPTAEKKENGLEDTEDSISVETSESASTPDTVKSAPVGPGQETEDGQTVVATARGVFSSEGGVLVSKETGVSIVIPAGALPDGVEQEIYFKVCSGNSILPPLDEDKGETLLSPLVMCGPHGLQFKKPVELKLPHSASVNPESWSFALKSSDSPSGQPTQWQNMTLAGSEGVAQGRVNQSSVSVLVDHF
ncbi:hypothetical protein BaRGS_00017676 [Batillaria attramentaria]|uniref:Tight junction protein ZO-1 n=1 Tax=Batillaria attramentaria TaxID=370345 RepID=A0ABD0KWH2_9CAEN